MLDEYNYCNQFPPLVGSQPRVNQLRDKIAFQSKEFGLALFAPASTIDTKKIDSAQAQGGSSNTFRQIAAPPLCKKRSRGFHTTGARNDARFVITSRFAIEFGASQPGLSGKTARQSAPNL